MNSFSARRSVFLISMALAACGGAQEPAPKSTAALDLPVARGGSDLPQAATSPQAGEDDAAIPIRSGDPTLGSRLAPVTIVEFEDFQCPFCSRAEKTMQAIEEEYGPDKLRVVWKNNPLPFHPNARPAAEAAMGVFALAGNGAFWKFHDVAFDHQADLGDAKYAEWAKLLGVDSASLQRGIAAHTWSARIDDDLALAKKIGSNGTPAFWINGASLVGAQPREKFEEVIDTELHKAQAKIESGTPRDRVYSVMTAENIKLPKPSDDDDDGPPEDTKTVFKVPVGNSPIKGSKTALVTIIEFSDFQCPYCKRTEPTLKQIMQTYGNDVRLVWKNEPLPFHDRAEPAAELAMEARAEKGDAGFWAAHDALFDSQPDLKDSDLEGVAKKIGIDVSKVKSAIKAHKYKPQISIDEQLGEDVQASGTPHFFINGRRLVGAQPFDKFKAIIDAELVNAKAQLAKGTAPTALYDALIKDGKGGPTPPEKKTVPASATAPVRGKATAKVTLVEFADFQCPFCKRAEDDAITQVRKDYPDNVKIVWRDMPLPFHQNAEPAAEAAREALTQQGSTGFWKMHDLLFANQTNLDRPALDGYAKQVGLDMTKFANAIDNHTHKTEIDADAKAAQTAGISGTPAFLVNGYFLSGAQPYSKFKRLIDLSLQGSATPAATP